MSTSDPAQAAGTLPQMFATTHWSQVLSARNGESPGAREVPLSFWGIYSATNSVSGQVENHRVRITVFVTLVAGQEAVIEAKVELPEVEQKPPCNCVPWCGIVGGTFGGVQKVVAGGGKRGDCTDAPVVNVTGPGAINLPINGKPRRFNPTANGTWTVTATICGITRRARSRCLEPTLAVTLTPAADFDNEGCGTPECP
jgi:hypothetical protein